MRNLYEEWIRELEHATFTQLVFTTAGEASPLISTFLKHLAKSSQEEGHGLQHSHWLAVGPAKLQSAVLSSDVHSRITIIGGQDNDHRWAVHSMTALIMSLLWSPDFSWSKSYPS